MFTENDDGYFVDCPENRGGSNGRISRQSSVGNIFPFIILGIAIAIYTNYGKWKLAVIYYISQLKRDPKQIFHVETFIYIIVLFLIVRFVFGLFKKFMLN